MFLVRLPSAASVGCLPAKITPNSDSKTAVALIRPTPDIFIWPTYHVE